MVAAQRFMIPTAGVCLLIGIAVYGRDFDPGFAGTYALGSLTAIWIASALLAVSTVASYGAYAGDWTRHISPRLHSDRSIWQAMLIGGLFGMGGPFMWGTFTAATAFSATFPGRIPTSLDWSTARPCGSCRRWFTSASPPAPHKRSSTPTAPGWTPAPSSRR